MGTNPWAKPETTSQQASEETQIPPAAPSNTEVPEAIPPAPDTETPPPAPASEETPSETQAPTIVDTGVSEAPSSTPEEVPVVQPHSAEPGKVTAIIPKDFQLTLDDMTVVKYQAGTHDIPVEHAEHWYAKANGVKIYTGN